MTRIPRIVALSLGAVLLVPAGLVSAQEMGEQAFRVSNQSDEPKPGAVLLTTENALLERRDDGVTITLTMPTPEARGYKYPQGLKKRNKVQPELFTGWAFIFNDPTICTSNPEPPRCGAADNPMIVNFAGHANSVTHHGGDLAVNEAADGMLVMTGVIPAGEGSALTDPAGAEIHAAIAPHGRAKMGEIRSPAGGPTCDCWWVATFLPPSQLQ